MSDATTTKKRNPPRRCVTEGCSHRAHAHAPAISKFRDHARPCLATNPDGKPCACANLALPPKPKRARKQRKPWERKICPRNMGRVGARWRDSLKVGPARGPGVFVLWDLVRDGAFLVGESGEDMGKVALAHVRTAEKLVPGGGGSRAPLISRGAAALWTCAETDLAVRAEAVKRLCARYGCLAASEALAAAQAASA